MPGTYRQITLLILAAVVIAGCAAAPTPPTVAPPTAAPPTPTVAIARSTNTAIPAPATAAPAAPTHTATPAPPTVAPGTETPSQETEGMKIGITIGDQVITATLADSRAAQDFTALLPLALTLEDYAGTEKISDLPRRLSTEGSPAGSDPAVGDIAYYAPWGNLAIYYRDFGYSNGLVILGKLDGGADALSAPGPVQVTIDALK